MEIRTRGGKSFGIHYTGYRDNARVGTRYRDIVFIGNRKSLSRARTKGGSGVTRTRAGRKARDIVTRRASRRVFFAFPTNPLWLLKGRRAAYEGTEKKKERKRAFKNERGSIP